MEVITEKDILQIIKNDSWMMKILEAVRDLDLPDCWIGAGFVRSKVWDYLHGYTERTPLPDIDVVYFDPQDTKPEKTEQKITATLHEDFPTLDFEVLNQSRTHLWHNDKPYRDATEALSKWVETATCVGVRLNKNNELELTAPLGIDDLVQLIVRQNPTILQDNALFMRRIKGKSWQKLWPNLTIIS